MRLLAAAIGLSLLLLGALILWMDRDDTRPESVLAERIERAGRARRSDTDPAELSLAPPPGTEEHPLETESDSPVPAEFAATLHGRVIEMPSGRPLPDTPIEVVADLDAEAEGRLRAGVRTDELGLFELPWFGPETAWARAHPRRGFVLEDPWKKLDPGQRRGEEEIVLRLRRGRSDLVRGRAVNSLTGEGVFSLTVRVRGSGISETCQTDGTGHFESSLAFPEGKVRVALSDDAPEGSTPLGRFEREHLEGGRLNPNWVLDIEIGPSYVVLPSVGPSLPPGSRVALREDRPPEHYSTRILCTEWGGFEIPPARGGPEQTRAALPEEPREWAWLLPRPSPGGPWVRYPHQLHPPLEEEEGVAGSEPRLVLDDPSREWRAEARVPSILGHHPDPIVLPLEPSAALLGTVGDSTGAPVAGALVQLRSPSSSAPTLLHLSETLEDGSFEFPSIEPGLYRILVSPRVHAGDDFELRCTQGLNTAPHVLLPPAIDVGDIAGKVLLPDGVPHSVPKVTLSSAEGSQWTRTVGARYTGTSGGERAYRFRFDHVPGGRYVVSMGASVVGHRRERVADWTPRKRTVLPPHEGLVFRSRADGKPVELVVNLESERGRPTHGARLVLGPGGLVQGTFDLHRNRHLRIPRDGRLEWKLLSPFHRALSGDESDLVFRDEEAVLDLKLRTGFSATFQLRGAPRRSHRTRPPRSTGALPTVVPIVGAKAYVNNKLVGRSDRRGNLEIDLPRRPSWIGILAPGWGEGVLLNERSGGPLVVLHRLENESTGR